VEIELPELHPNQEKIANDNHRFKVLTCGRRWGKTMMCAAIALQKAVSGGRVWWIGPTYSVSGIGWQEVKSILSDFPLWFYEIHEADRTVTFATKGFISFKSAERPENLRGESLSYAIFDEADFIDEEVWTESIRPALSDQKGGAIFISTPYHENGWFHHLWKKGMSGDDPEIKSWHFSSYTNPYMDPKEIDAAKANMSSLSFKREYMAEFVGSVGARVKREWLKYFDKQPDKLDVVLGVDLAISLKTDADYTAACVLGRAKDGNIYVLAQERVRASFGEQQIFIKQMAEKWKPRLIAVEQVAYQAAMVQQLQATTKLTVRGFKTTKDKITRFAPLEARFEHGQVLLASDLPSYFESELLEFPVSAHDDCVDSMSIAWEALGSTFIAPPIAPIFSIRSDTDWRS
jgi:predicted phage terminase large subunit-like protein